MYRSVLAVGVGIICGVVLGYWIPVTHSHGAFLIIDGNGHGYSAEFGPGDGEIHRACDALAARRRDELDTVRDRYLHASVLLELAKRTRR